jgi:hypothetical protein
VEEEGFCVGFGPKTTTATREKMKRPKYRALLNFRFLLLPTSTQRGLIKPITSNIGATSKIMINR